RQFARRRVEMDDALYRTAMNFRLRLLERRLRRFLVTARNRRLHLLDVAAHTAHAGAVDGSSPHRLADALLCGLVMSHDEISCRSRGLPEGGGLYPRTGATSRTPGLSDS